MERSAISEGVTKEDEARAKFQRQGRFVEVRHSIFGFHIELSIKSSEIIIRILILKP